MDAFESVVATLLERKGYWTRIGFKVDLTRQERRQIGRPTSPRWEIDIIAYKGSTNDLLSIECKSHLNSPGVRFTAFDGSNEKQAKKFKLFNDKTLREVVLNRLSIQLMDAGFCAIPPKITLGLVAGKIYGDANPLREHFEKNGWWLRDICWLKEELKELSKSGYDNTIVAIVSKLILNK